MDDELIHLLLEAERIIARGNLRGQLFDKQRAFAADPAKRKALLCSRRAGKTTRTASEHFHTGLTYNGTLSRIWAITRQRVKELFWDDLKKMNYEAQLDARFNEVELSIRLPNDSKIHLVGADKLKEVEKKRGQKLRLATIDETQLYPADALRALTEDVEGPSLADLDGTLELMGTPGLVCVGPWHDITAKEKKGWSVHKWTVLDNPCFPKWANQPEWRELAIAWLDAMKRENGWSDDHPTYQREWLGRWVNDFGALVYRYDPIRNGYDTLPKIKGNWSHIVGSDLGHDDAFSVVVWAFSPERKEAYEVYTFKESGLVPDQWVEVWRNVQQRYKPIKMRVDTGGLGKAIVEGIRRKYSIPLEAAEKTEKLAHQELMNGEFYSGRLMVRRGSAYEQELSTLAKDPDDPTKEDPRLPNHACDAGLYGFRDLLRYHFAKIAPDDTRTESEKQIEQYKTRVQQRMRDQKEKPWWARTRMS